MTLEITTAVFVTVCAGLGRWPHHPRAHTLALAAGVVHYLNSAIHAALADQRNAVVYSLLLSFACYAYHRAALRRVAFFRARAGAGR